jgi:hypothetical protein
MTMCDMCEKGADAFMADMIETIDKCGHAIIYVSPGEGRDQFFSYTVGLTLKYGYEIMQSGLSPHQSSHLLNDLPEAIMQRGIALAEGLIIEGLLSNGYNIKMREVSDSQFLGIAKRLYGSYPRAWQAMWPDPNNRFPDEPGYDPEGINVQELL